MRRIYPVALLLVAVVVILAAVKLDLFSSPRSTPEEPLQDGTGPRPGTEPDIRTATLAAVGGLYPHQAVLNENHRSDGKYDFWPSFELIAPYFQKVDLAILTLETMQAGPEAALWGVSGYTGHTEKGILTFNAPLELSHALKKAGCNLYSFANNHCLDRDLEGLQASLRNVRELGFHTTGAYLSAEEREAVDIIEINGIKVAVVAYTYGTNCIPLRQGCEYAVNLVPSFEEIDPLLDDIRKARTAGADLIVVMPHWGGQYIDYPFERKRELARQMAAASADKIIGGHPKFVQPGEWIVLPESGGGTRSVPVRYSLGNFYTDQHYPVCSSDLVEYGMLLSLELTKDMDSGRAWISALDYDIHWCYRDWGHRLLVLSEVFEKGPERFNLNRSQLQRLESRYRDNIEIIERYGFSENKPGAVGENRRPASSSSD